MRLLSWLAITSFALVTCGWSAPRQAFADSSRAELLTAAPELSALEFDSNQSMLDPLLHATGAQVEIMLAKFVNVSMAEEVHEMRFDNAHLEWKEHRDRFLYLVATRPFSESRRPVEGAHAAQPNAKSVFLIAGPFVELLGDLLPQNQRQSRFRYLGRMAEGGKPSLVVAFIARDQSREGLVWVDEATKHVLRFRMDALNHPNEGKFKSFTRDVCFAPVEFSAVSNIWLPLSAAVHAQFATGELHSIHRFSDYRVEKNNDIGRTDGPVVSEEDGFEVLLKGLAALEAGEPGDAVAVLRQAAARLPERIEPGFYLGLALYKNHDWPEAETRFRETIKHTPKLAAAHDGLGAVLLARGNQPGAVAEFQDALRLEPGNAKIRANLEAATRMPGDRVTGTEATVAAAGGDAAIKVDVRQVLVPVVVTDKQGHHITGLTQSDFQVFEDGVEEKVTAFASERADVVTPATSAASDASPDRLDSVATGLPQHPPTRHTYVICLDMMHTDFANSVHVREALHKLFQQEQAADSRYVVIALGKGLEVIQDPTSDPAKVLETLDGPDFRHLYLRGQKSASKFEISAYEEDLQRAKQGPPCNPYDGSCQDIAETWVHRAEELAKRERARTTEFLAQFRAVVEQLARDNGRRTMVLISDGILLAPGKIPFGLLEAYFPGYHTTRSLDNLQYLIEPIFKLAVKANVAIYTIDSRGLYTSPGDDVSRNVVASVVNQVNREWSDIAMHQGLTLSEIAEATGGTAFKNSNDLLAGLQRAFADGREYYTLAYVSTNEAQDGKFRKIEVRVRHTRAVVNAKRGYWATSQ